MTRALLIGALGLAVSACAPAPRPDARDAVSELVQRWSDAGEAQDWDTIADTYADSEGFAWIEQGETRYANRAAIVEGLNQARGMSASIRNDVSDIVVTPLANDAAAFRANYILSVSSPAFSYSSEGVLSGVAIRQVDGWRFLQGSFSERPRAATPEQAG